MARRKRQTTTFSLSFLDIMSCGFGAVVLVFLIIDRSLNVEIETVNAQTLAEIDLLQEDIRKGKEGLARIQNAVKAADLEIVEANGMAQQITDELKKYEALIASIEELGLTESETIIQLKAEINKLKKEIFLKEEAAKANAGRNAREFIGEGNRQYLTGLNLGGQRIVILVDASASMLANQIVNVIRIRNMDANLQKQAGKWVRTINTVQWLTAQLPITAQFQVITFNTEARAVINGTDNQWLSVADGEKLEEINSVLENSQPSGGTSLLNAFSSLKSLPDQPDNIFLVTDGLPTQGERTPRGNKVTGKERLKLFREATKLLPRNVPVNIILLPMDGDPMAASEFWQLAQSSNGSFLSPSSDWP